MKLSQYITLALLSFPAIGYCDTSAIPKIALQAPSDISIQCDNLASNPTNQDNPKNIVPVEFNNIEPKKAIDICQQAVTQYPNIPRYQYNIARTYQVDENYKKALALYQTLADKGYVSAQVNLGLLYDGDEDAKASLAELQKGV